MNNTQKPRVLFIGFDAAESTLIEKWINDGSLPHLAELRRKGGFGKMASTGEYNASVWPSFYTGTNPGDHAYHNFLMWDAKKMRHVRPRGDEEYRQPFWRELADRGVNTVVLDVPDMFAPPPGKTSKAFELGNWASHYRMRPAFTTPDPGALKQIERKYGRDPMPLEKAGLMTVQEFFALRDELLEITETQTRLTIEMIEKGQPDWEVMLMVFGATHRAGHMLWSDKGVLGEVPEKHRQAFGRIIFDIYVACDERLGRILAAADKVNTKLNTKGDAIADSDSGLHIFVFAGHGMTDNRSLADLLPEMLRRVIRDDRGDTDTDTDTGTDTDTQEEQAKQEEHLVTETKDETPPKIGLKQVLRKLLPLSFRSYVKDRLPQDVQDYLTLSWRIEKHDWVTTPAFCVLPDLQGQIRINLKGRERDGIVSPGQEYEDWIAKITDGLMTFVDKQTGEPIISAIHRNHAFYPNAKLDGILPDLAVEYPQRVAADFESMVSPRYGRIKSPFDGKAPEGRSGHHAMDGWFLATGRSIQPGSSFDNLHELDLAPTFFALFGLSIPERFTGTPITAIVGDESATSASPDTTNSPANSLSKS